ncbi:MAG: cysteine synthase A [Proteobacteria bacterium]|nr:cysteine synthase A [Pseudomonadota bacterium]
MIYNSILDTIGKTPIIKINTLAPQHVNMFVKVESFNPMASVKDRLAHAIILDAENKKLLKPGDTVIEATSGNTGIALAMVCAAKGYKFVAVMTETFSIERRKLIRALGGKVVLTPAAERGTGMVRIAEELAKDNNWFLAKQFENLANPAYHRSTTAPEILQDFADLRLDYFVSGYGTGGTITGVGEVLKSARPEVKIIGTEPLEAALLSGNEWNPHKIQGLTPDFIADVLNTEIIDEVVPVNDQDAKKYSLALASQEGILCGISSGATFAAAMIVAKKAAPGSNILAMIPDTGERYLSTYLYEDFIDGSDEL